MKRKLLFTAMAACIFSLSFANVSLRQTKSDPVDYTSSITNSNFEAGSITGWSVESGDGSNIYKQNNTGWKNTDGSQAKEGSTFAEYWIASTKGTASNKKIYQSISGLQAGAYKLTAKAQASSQSGKIVENVYLYAGKDSVEITVTNAYSVVGFIVAEGETVEIGFASLTTNANWICVDDFKLEWIGSDATAAINAAKVVLEELYSDANAFFEGINLANVASEGNDEAGKYKYTPYKALEDALLAAKSIIDDIDNSTFTGTKTDIEYAATTLKNAQKNTVIYIALNPLKEGLYFIKISDMYINNDGSISNGKRLESTANNGLVNDIVTTDSTQIFKVSIVESVSRYSFYSVKDSRHLTEDALLQSTWGDQDNNWRTMNILYNGDKYAIQTAGNSASKGYWRMNGEQLYSGGQNQSESFIFELISLESILSDMCKTAMGKLTLATGNIGNAKDQYTQERVDALTTALTNAQTLPIAKSLVDLTDAINDFIPNLTSTSISNEEIDDKPFIKAGTNNISVSSRTNNNIIIYNAEGQSIFNSTIDGKKDISINSGFYIVKIGNTIQKVLVK